MEILEDHADNGLSESELEALFFDICARAGIPRPVRNLPLLGRRPDFVWPEARLIVEADGWAAHGRRRNFESDRARDAEFAAHGYLTLRVTYRQLVHEPHTIARRLAAIYRQRIPARSDIR